MTRSCPTIIDLKFDEESLKGLERIAELQHSAKLGKSFVGIGQLLSIVGGLFVPSSSSGTAKIVTERVARATSDKVANILDTSFKATSSGAGQTSYAVHTANWEIFFDAMGSFDKISLALIEREAMEQAMKHSTSPKEYQFWYALQAGCKPNAK